MQELVSVIITTHNREDLLERAIRSVIAQDYLAIELIVIDDFSNEKTSMLMNSLRDECEQRFIRFVYQRNAINSGSNFSRNCGYALSQGKFVTGLDDDDYFLPERVSLLVSRYNDKYAFVCDTLTRLDKDREHAKNIDTYRVIGLQDILCENVVGNQVLTTREKLMSVGCFSLEIKQQQDRDVWIKLIAKFGPGLKYPFSTQMVDAEHSDNRITKQIKKYTSYRKLYFKFRDLMSEETKSNNLFQLMSFRGMSAVKMNSLLFRKKKNMKLCLKLTRRSLMEFLRRHGG